MPEPISSTTGRGGVKASARCGGAESTSIPHPGSRRINADAADGVVRLRRGWKVRIRCAGRPSDIRTYGRFARVDPEAGLHLVVPDRQEAA
jgi:hypothetical protein